MSTTESQHGDRDATAVRDAARLSLAARGVRVHLRRAREADSGWAEPWSWEVGVADPAARSVRVRHFYSEHSPVVKLAEASARFFGDESPPEDVPDPVAETIEIGRDHYYGGPGCWLQQSDHASYGPARGLWPLEVVLGTIGATRAATDTDVRGVSCARYVLEILSGEAAGREGTTLVDPPNPDDDWRRIHGDVCVDGGGLIRRIAWSPAFGKRHRPGLLGRAAAIFVKDSTSDQDVVGRLWNVIEFWDYGCNVDIAAPTDLIDPHSGPPFREIIRDLWRMRREHKRRTAGSQQSLQK